MKGIWGSCCRKRGESDALIFAIILCRGQAASLISTQQKLGWQPRQS